MAARNVKLVHSHAHEDVPGTVDMNVVEGDQTAYGLALYPVPAQDPNDPLQWSKSKKMAILVTICLFSFLSNTALLGPSVYIAIFAKDFGITPVVASGLVNYPNLAFGFGSLIFVPLYHRIGRRPVMLISIIIYAAGLIGASQATSFSGLMAARVVHAFGSSVCEALPAQIVNDIFYLHERGSRLGYYTVALCLGSTGPLYAGYMLGAGKSWQLFFYVEFAFAMGLLILAFFCVEESMYKRTKQPLILDTQTVPNPAVISEPTDIEKEAIPKEGSAKGSSSGSEDIPARKTFLQTLKPWGEVDGESDFFMMIIRSFSYYAVPPVLWVVTTYGIYIGLAALVVNFTFPIKITAPPYNWSQTNSGLITVPSAIGNLLGMLPFNSLSDRFSAYLTRRNGGIREAEFRLPILIPMCFITPAGLILYGFAGERSLPWIAYFIGVAMIQFGDFFYFTYTLTYAIDSYNANVPEMLIAMNLGKQSISFGFGFYVLDWVMETGYAKVIAGIFTGVLLLNNLALFVFMAYGKRMRIWFADTWLARMHRNSIKEIMAH